MSTKTAIRMRPINKERFDKMSKQEKRIAICKDLLLRYSARKFRLEQGDYCEIAPNGDSKIFDKLYEGKKSERSKFFKKFLNSKESDENSCVVCAKGALFVNWVANFNNYDINGAERFGGETTPELRSIFGCTLLDCFEAVFEGYYSNIISFTLQNKLRREFGLERGETNFFNMVNNVIKNKGFLVFEDGFKIGE